MKDINSRIDRDKGVIYLTEKERTAQLIKPILRGRDIKRYSYEWAGLWIILAKFDSHKYLEKDYPIIYNHLLQHKDKLQARGQCRYARGNKVDTGKGYLGQHHWLELDNNPKDSYLNEFAKPKIVYSEIVREPQFYLDNGEFKFGYFYAEATSFILSGNKNFKSSLEYLLGLLHSKLCTFAFKEFYAGGGLGESGYRYKKAFLENLPIPKITQSQEAEFSKIVNAIIQCKKSLENFNNEVYPHYNTIKTHEVQTSKALSGWGIDKGEGATSPNSNPSPLSKEEQNATLKDLESRLDSMVFSLYGLNDEEIKLISNGGGKYSLAYLLLACVESQFIVLVKSLCKNFELELKEAFKFCEGLKVPQKQYEGKIIYPNMAKEFIAYLDMQGFFTNQKCFILSDNIKDKNRLLYLTAILNSKTNFWYFKQIGATLGASGYEMSKIFVEKLPVVETHKIDSTLLKEIENLASEILESKEADSNSSVADLESRLDSLVYKAYGLNENEINLIESELSTREREREQK